MKRRDFLRTLIGGAAAAVVLPHVPVEIEAAVDPRGPSIITHYPHRLTRSYRSLDHWISNSGSYQGLSAPYPKLFSPTTEAGNTALTRCVLENAKRRVASQRVLEHMEDYNRYLEVLRIR